MANTVNTADTANRRVIRWAVVTAVALGLAACGGDAEPAADRIDEAIADNTVDEAELESIVEQAVDEIASSGEIELDEQDQERLDDVLAGDAEFGSCTASVSGDVSAEWTGTGGAAAVGTDYWYSDDELRRQYEIFGDESRSFDDTLAAGEPITALLLLNCGTVGVPSVSIYPTNSTTRSELPFGPGSYPIAGGGALGAADAEPGQFSVLVALDEDSIWGVTGGTFEITEWDAEHIAGSFAFGIEETFTDAPRAGQVEGTFDFSCFADACS